jgi:hypothetical protein
VADQEAGDLALEPRGGAASGRETREGRMGEAGDVCREGGGFSGDGSGPVRMEERSRAPSEQREEKVRRKNERESGERVGV